MPLYPLFDYACQAPDCGARFEARARRGDEVSCTLCGGPATRQFTPCGNITTYREWNSCTSADVAPPPRPQEFFPGLGGVIHGR